MAPKFEYSQEKLLEALNAIKNGMPVTKASKFYNVPYTTLFYKNKGKRQIKRKMGPATVLSEEEENTLVNWIFHLADAGFPATKEQLITSVEMLIKKLGRKTSFKDNKPGRHWYEGFLRRHPNISTRITQSLTSSRASVSELNIRKWFAEIKDYLDSNGYSSVLEDPRRIFNCDETAFFLSPKESKVLVRRGEKSVYNFVNNDEKQCLTVLLGGSALGAIPPPMVVYSYKRIPRTIAESTPSNWGVGTSENGWMTGETFYEYIANVFYPWLANNGIEFPVVLFVDGHTSHMTLELSNFCSSKQIILVALYPNATHILQPMDVAVFHPLKSGWRKAVHKWRTENEVIRLTKEHFPKLLQSVIESTVRPQILQSGFRACSL